MATQEIVTTNRFTDEQLAGIKEYADVEALFKAAGVNVVKVSDYGTGFEILDTKDKGRLVGVPFVIIEGYVNQGEQGDFVSLAVITKTGEKLIINDGSSGICAQFVMMVNQRTAKGDVNPHMGIGVENGLTESKYYYNEKTQEKRRVKPDGDEWKPASTFYLS